MSQQEFVETENDGSNTMELSVMKQKKSIYSPPED